MFVPARRAVAQCRDLWYFDGPPDTPEKIAAIFDAAPHRIMFAGHYHRWLLATPSGLTDWSGDAPIHLTEAERYFVVVGALCEGRFAVFDTETSELVPLSVAGERSHDDSAAGQLGA